MPRLSGITLWNVIQFQLGWAALVISAARGVPWLGVGLLAILIAIHLRWFARRREWLLLLAVGVGGWFWESAVHSLGLLAYPGHAPGQLAAPVWMAGLWVNFASVLNHSLAWLKGQGFIAALLGAIGGPLAFLAGERLGAVTFLYPVTATLVLVVAWGTLLPALLHLASRLEALRPSSQLPPGRC